MSSNKNLGAIMAHLEWADHHESGVWTKAAVLQAKLKLSTAELTDLLADLLGRELIEVDAKGVRIAPDVYGMPPTDWNDPLTAYCKGAL